MTIENMPYVKKTINFIKHSHIPEELKSAAVVGNFVKITVGVSAILIGVFGYPELKRQLNIKVDDPETPKLDNPKSVLEHTRRKSIYRSIPLEIPTISQEEFSNIPIHDSDTFEIVGYSNPLPQKKPPREGCEQVDQKCWNGLYAWNWRCKQQYHRYKLCVWFNGLNMPSENIVYGPNWRYQPYPQMNQQYTTQHKQQPQHYYLHPQHQIPSAPAVTSPK